MLHYRLPESSPQQGKLEQKAQLQAVLSNKEATSNPLALLVVTKARDAVKHLAVPSLKRHRGKTPVSEEQCLASLEAGFQGQPRT